MGAVIASGLSAAACAVLIPVVGPIPSAMIAGGVADMANKVAVGAVNSAIGKNTLNAKNANLNMRHPVIRDTSGGARAD